MSRIIVLVTALLLASTVGNASTWVLGQNFDGLGQGVAGFTVPFDPPDPNGAVGLTQYVQWVNHSFAVFDKTTGALIKTLSSTDPWIGASGACATSTPGDSDGIVAYDRLANRWVLSRFFATNSPPFWECVAVSTTSDATGTYFPYSFPYNNNNFNAVEQRTAEISVPVAVTVFPGEIYRAPRSWTERSYPKLTYFHEVNKGGHFAAWEQPQLFAEELRAAFRPLRRQQ